MTQVSAVKNVQSAPAHGVSFKAVLRVWTRVVLLSFGGPAAQICTRILVDEKRWISESRFLYALNLVCHSHDFRETIPVRFLC